MNSVCQLIDNRTVGLEWGTQKGTVDSDCRLESRLGQVWSKLAMKLKGSDHELKAVGAMEGFGKGSG